MTPPIINRPDLRSFEQKYGQSLITLMFWVMFFFFMRPLIGMVGWYFGLQLFTDVMIVHGGYQALIELLGIYFGIIVAMGLILEGWALYNLLRYGRESYRPVMRLLIRCDLLESPDGWSWSTMNAAGWRTAGPRRRRLKVVGHSSGRGQSSLALPKGLMTDHYTEVVPATNCIERKAMSRFRKLTHAIWHCQYHIVWVPKYRYRVLDGDLAQEVQNLLTDIQRAKSLRSRRNEYSEGSCPSDHNGAAESVDIRVDGTFERSHRDTGVEAFQRITKEAILGEPSLGSGLLRGYRRYGRRNDHGAMSGIKRNVRKR